MHQTEVIIPKRMTWNVTPFVKLLLYGNSNHWSFYYTSCGNDTWDAYFAIITVQAWVLYIHKYLLTSSSGSCRYSCIKENKSHPRIYCLGWYILLINKQDINKVFHRTQKHNNGRWLADTRHRSLYSYTLALVHFYLVCCVHVYHTFTDTDVMHEFILITLAVKT